ncbi:MAG: ATPase, T2SS/T4P/T4SS family [Candidatus Thorarchaeota archaeon]
MIGAEPNGTRPHVIVCPDNECNDCKGNLVPERCGKVRLESDRKMIIIEPMKKMIHLRHALLDCDGIESKSKMIESVFIEEFDQVESWKDLVEAYAIGSYLSLYFKGRRDNSIQHISFPRVRTSLEYSLIEEMNNQYLKSFKNGNLRRTTFQGRLETSSNWIAQEISNSLPELNSTTIRVIADFVTHKNTPISGMFPLILDECVEEIYLDRPGEQVYFDHSKFGRVQTNFQMNDDEVLKLTTLLRAESNLHLDRKNPSLKTDLVLYDVPLRFSTSMPPLSPDGMNLEIRRARVKPFTIFDLVQNGTLSYKAAALLILSINSRLNITITGEPGTGKTTLMNALDFTTPEIWRKIYIEDVLESRMIEGNHQVRFRVTPLDENTSMLDKSTEIIKCLHRSPDYLILGEIQTIEHSRALFQSIVAGLRSIQTCHSSSPSSLVTRWVVEHHVSTSSLALMDLIVSLKKPNPGASERFVDRIAEVCRKEESGLTEFTGLNVIYDSNNPEELGEPATNGMFQSLEFKETINSIVGKLKSFEYSSENSMNWMELDDTSMSPFV